MIRSKEEISQKIHELSYKHDNEIMLAYDDLMELVAQAEQRGYKRGIKHTKWFSHRNKLCKCYKPKK